MTGRRQHAVAELVAVLVEENAVLTALDYRRVGDFVDRKRAALAALNAADPDPSGRDPAAQAALALRLKQVVDENRTLLRQAIKVQNRIMGVIAGAARQAQIPTGYGARGNKPRSSVASAVALIVRA